MSAPQPSTESIIESLMEENQQLIENKRYLVAVIRDLDKRIKELEKADEPEDAKVEVLPAAKPSRAKR